MWRDLVEHFLWFLNTEDSMQIDTFIIKAQGWWRANCSQNWIISLVTHPHKTLKCCLTFIGNCKSAQDYLKRSRDLENVLAKCSWILWFYASRHKKQAMRLSYLGSPLRRTVHLTKRKVWIYCSNQLSHECPIKRSVAGQNFVLLCLL